MNHPTADIYGNFSFSGPEQGEPIFTERKQGWGIVVMACDLEERIAFF
jgi:hypothetical protein